MTNDMKSSWQLDFEYYEKLLKERVLYTETALRDNFICIYRKIYLYTSFTNSFTNIDKRSNIESFYNECKNNLIISYDLANINYINASKQILRSAIEGFFRLSLAISKYIEYRENKKQRIYSATTTLKDLRRMQDTHKVGVLTRYVLSYYEETPVITQYKDLNKLYSNLSSIVHVNKTENFTPHRYLKDYIELNQEEIETHLLQLTEVLDNIIQSIYYFSFYLTEEEVEFNKRDLVEFEHTLKSSSCLDLIENYFDTL